MMDHHRETDFLLAAARPDVPDPGRVRALTATADTFDWGFVVDQAYRHNVLPLLGRNVTRSRLYPPPESPSQAFLYQELLLNAYQANQARNAGLLRELSAVLAALAEREVTVLVRKGLPLAQDAYGDLGARRSYDIDLMVDPEHLPELRTALTELGYAQGNPSLDGRTVTPMPRHQSAYWRLWVPNLAYRRPTSEPFVNTFIIDVCLNQFLPGSGYDLPAGGLAQRSRAAVVFGVPMRVFDHEEMVVDLSAHLFKEATTLHYVQVGRDLTVAKFLDIATYAKANPVDWERVTDLCRQRGIEAPVFYALHYTEILYPGTAPAAVLDALRPESTDYLREIGATDKNVHRWAEDFRERLFDVSRATRAPRTKAPL